MKVVHLSTTDIRGGAARSAYRLHKGLLEIGQDSHILVRNKHSHDPRVHVVDNDDDESKTKQQHDSKSTDHFGYGLTDFHLKSIQEHYIDRNRTSISNTLFSLGYPGIDVSQMSLVQNADVINLHWVAHFQSPETIHNILALGKPVVWTLHDMWSFTGGCHYSSGCEGYVSSCVSCPQLENDPYSLPSNLLSEKHYLSTSNLTIVTPSQWLGSCAQKSHIFSDRPVNVIPYSLETNTFHPIEKKQAKESLNIDPNCIALLIGAENGNEKRKGFYQFITAIQSCLTNKRFQEKVDAGEIRIICFGQPSDDLIQLPIPISSMGYVESDEALCRVYSAADVFILPSLEDNLPNTMLEAMSCSTPVIGFNIGGVPDMVRNGETGWICDIHTPSSMVNAILESVLNNGKRSELGKKGRSLLLNNHKLNMQAGNYSSLYKKISNPQKLITYKIRDKKTEFTKSFNRLSLIALDIVTHQLIDSKEYLSEERERIKILREKIKKIRINRDTLQDNLDDCLKRIDNIDNIEIGSEMGKDKSYSLLERIWLKFKKLINLFF